MSIKTFRKSLVIATFAFFFSNQAFADATAGSSTGSPPPGNTPLGCSDSNPEIGETGDWIQYQYRFEAYNPLMMIGCEGSNSSLGLEQNDSLLPYVGGDASVSNLESQQNDSFLPSNDGDYVTIQSADFYSLRVDEPIPSTIKCFNADSDTLSCFGSPVTLDVPLSYAWTITGPIQFVPSSAPNDERRVTCVPGQDGTGLIQLSVSSVYAPSASAATIEVHCTAN